MGKKKYNYNTGDGVWRTIGGRKVFIKNGQSLSDAMKESGKFKKTSDVKRGEYQEARAGLEDIRESDKLKTMWQTTETEGKPTPKKILKQTEKVNEIRSELDFRQSGRYDNEVDYSGNISDLKGKHIEKGKEQFEVGDLKRKALETLPKDYIDSHEGDLYLKKTKESTDLLNRMKDKDSGLLSTFKDQQTGEEWYEIPFANMSDDYKEKATKESTGNDYLPKESKITTQGTSNRKEVSDNIQAHILSYYDNPVDFMEQMDAFNNMPTRWHAGQEMAKQGFYAIYYDDQRDFLDNLGINPKGKSFSDDKVFQTYTSLVGRESEKLYTKMEKLFEQYKKEHKNSNATLDDFRKWFK